MKRTPGLWSIILVMVLIVTLAHGDRQMLIWDAGLMPAGGTRQRRNPVRNRERWARRWASRRCRRPSSSRREGKRTMKRRGGPAVAVGQRGQTPVIVRELSKRRVPQKAPPTMQRSAAEDPLADLRQSRGLIDLVDEQRLWNMLIRVVWPNGPVCPHCGERDVTFSKR